jgi:hypothetical protein
MHQRTKNNKFSLDFLLLYPVHSSKPISQLPSPTYTEPMPSFQQCLADSKHMACATPALYVPGFRSKENGISWRSKPISQLPSPIYTEPMPSFQQCLADSKHTACATPDLYVPGFRSKENVINWRINITQQTQSLFVCPSKSKRDGLDLPVAKTRNLNRDQRVPVCDFCCTSDTMKWRRGSYIA